MKPIEKAIRLYKDEFNCPQAVLCAYAEELGLDKETALKIASPFGGGIARNGKICGAITGGLMVIGLKNWDSQKEHEAGKADVYRISNQFMDEIKKRNNTLDCEELLGISVSTTEGRAIVKEKKLNEKVCHKVINDVVNVLEKLE
ncbi:MAG: C-GCAxxG-C-C family protein [Melioribacteraceae bacterium]